MGEGNLEGKQKLVSSAQPKAKHQKGEILMSEYMLISLAMVNPQFSILGLPLQPPNGKLTQRHDHRNKHEDL